MKKTMLFTLALLCSCLYLNARQISIFADGFPNSGGLEVNADGHIFTTAPRGADNDDLCNASPITIGEDCNGIPNIDTELATVQPDEPAFNCPGASGDTAVYNSVWYSFVAPAGQIYILAAPDDTSMANLSYRMNLFTLNGDCSSLSNLELVDCNAPQAGLQTAPALLTTLEEGQTYYLQISGSTFSGPSGVFSSTGCLSIIEVVAPANDDACNAISLELNADPQVFTNLGATAQPGEIAISPPPGTGGPLAVGDDGWAFGTNFIDHSVWFSFTTPAEGGNITIDLSSSFGVPGDFNTQLAVYEATDCNDFSTYTLIGAADNELPTGGVGIFAISPDLDLFCLEGNKTYYILVDGGNSFLFQPIAGQGYFSIQILGAGIQPLDAAILTEGPDCPGGSNGSLIARGTGGAGDLSYLWDTGDDTPAIISSLSAGTYTLTITDECGAEYVEAFTVPEGAFSPLTADAGTDDSACGGGTVELNASASGGLPIDTRRVFLQNTVSNENRRLISTELERPELQDTISSALSVQFSEMEFVGDALYAVSFNELYQVNTATGEPALIGSLGLPSVVDLSYVPASGTLYCLTSDGDVYEVDPATAAATFVVATGLAEINQAAIDNSGTIYLLTFDQNLYTASLSTGEPTLVAPFTVNPIAIRGLEIDPTDGRMYLTARTANGFPSTYTWQSMNEVDKATGAQVRFIRDLFSTTPTLAFAIQARPAAPYQYAWTPAAGLDNPASASPVFTMEETTTFTLAVSDACGQTDDMVTVSRLPDAMAEVGLSLNMGDTYNGIVINADTTITEVFTAANGCDSIVTTNIMVIINSAQESWSAEAIRISPNPASTVLTIATEGIAERPAQAFVRDLNGRLLLSVPLREARQDLDVSALPAGPYLLELRSARQFAVRRFVKL